MAEHLFKLKKDGKTVGYLELYGRPKGVIFSPFVKGVWVPYDVNNSAMDFNTAHPFVTKDKNGKNVFADDFVWFNWMGKKAKALIIKDDLFAHLVSCEGDVQGLPRTFCKSDRLHIESVEDKNEEMP